jgi:hypothetical protein
MRMPQETEVLKGENLLPLFEELKGQILQAAQGGTPIHEVEKVVWQQVLRIGREALGQFLALLGTGDRGETIALPDGRCCRRLETEHARRYVSIFGEFELSRVVYGSREGQKIEFVPLDNRLRLPASVYSYVLQDWAQGLCVESAFGQVETTLERLLGLKLSVDSLERMNGQMAERVEAYRSDRPAPAAETEGALLVASADGKGIVMRRSADDPAPAAHRTKGEKAGQKQMATVASVYTVDRHVRTAEDVVAALFRDRRDEALPRRPKPQNKHVWASLTRIDVTGETSGIDVVHQDILNELVERNRRDQQWVRPMIFLYDGQESLWEARHRHLPSAGIDILDLLHVTPRLWQAAHIFCKEGSAAAASFVRERCLRVLQGRVAGVIRGLREMATKRDLTAARRKTIAQICAYLEKNRERMHYDAYLAQGYPIASGVIEGACRHLVKDRMERAGMHWTPTGAQAMLDVRSVHVSAEWQQYQEYRIDKETSQIYPHRHLVDGPQYTLAA